MTTANKTQLLNDSTARTGTEVSDFARSALLQASNAIAAYAKGPLFPPIHPEAALAPVDPAKPTLVSNQVAITPIAALRGGGAVGGGGGGGTRTDTGPFELGSDRINYGSNTSANILVQFRCPTGSVRSGDPLVYLEPGSNGWCKFIRWYNPDDPTDGRFYLHIGADFWHGGGNCVWVVNGYYSVVDPTP